MSKRGLRVACVRCSVRLKNHTRHISHVFSCVRLSAPHSSVTTAACSPHAGARARVAAAALQTPPPLLRARTHAVWLSVSPAAAPAAALGRRESQHNNRPAAPTRGAPWAVNSLSPSVRRTAVGCPRACSRARRLEVAAVWKEARGERQRAREMVGGDLNRPPLSRQHRPHKASPALPGLPGGADTHGLAHGESSANVYSTGPARRPSFHEPTKRSPLGRNTEPLPWRRPCSVRSGSGRYQKCV
jgi:hypothetical protein